MGMKKKLQHKMRQTFYTPRNGKFSILKTIKSLDTVEKSLSEGVGKMISGGKKSSGGDSEGGESDSD